MWTWSWALAFAGSGTTVVPSRFERDAAGALRAIHLQLEVDPLGTVWLQLDTALVEVLWLHGLSVPEVRDGASLHVRVGERRVETGPVVVRPVLGVAGVDRDAVRVPPPAPSGSGSPPHPGGPGAPGFRG